MSTKTRLLNAFKDCDLDCAQWDKSALEELVIIALEALYDPTDTELLAPGPPYRIERAEIVPKAEGIQRRRIAWNKIIKHIQEND